MISGTVKTRFAPSPTGLLHLGNIRTALFNFLLARQSGGVFLLRLEDTDMTRGHDKYAAALLEDLRWLNLLWDEGPVVGGAAGPYEQSRRGSIYDKYLATLQAQRHAYPCFCTEHELAMSRKTQLAAGRPPRYSGRCRNLSDAEITERFAQGVPSTVRFRVTDGDTVEFEDGVRGRQAFRTDDIGDFIIRRSDGTPAFFFCNALDDALMGVTLVVRGEDHLANTPRQMLLLQALDLPVPRYAHIALVVGADGSPLSKRTGSRSVQELREAGFLPAAITNYLARLGHTYEDNSLLGLPALAANFSVDRLHRAPARYDEAQLLHWQKEAVTRASDHELWIWMSGRNYLDGGRIEDFVPEGAEVAFVQAIRDNITMPVDAFLWAGTLFARDGTYDHDAGAWIRDAGKRFFEIALQCLDGAPGDFKTYVRVLGETAGVKGKSLFMPLRAALTGEHDPRLPSGWRHGPELERIWNLLGSERIRRRLKKIVEQF